jgi:RNA polymerase sigma-70 factor, ECF subfamily
MIAPADFSSPPNRAPIVTDGAEPVSASRQAALHDAELVRRFNEGDATAFVEIVSRHRERLFSVAYAMLKNRADAEEIAQDTFIRAHRCLAKFRGDASLGTWLHRITLNLARNRYWYFFRRCRHTTLSLDCAFSDDGEATFSDLVATHAAGPARDAVACEFSELISLCMERLDTRSREILVLRNSLNFSYAEITRELGISVGTVKSRIARAREKLRVLLTEACPEFGPEATPSSWFEPVRPVGGIAIICA